MKKQLLISILVSALAAQADYTQAPVSMKTPWGEKITPENAWREYPRPQMVRPQWTNLNGLWEFAVTRGENTPDMPKAWKSDAIGETVASGEILVPFPIESSLSGVGRPLQPKEMLWYRRSFDADLKPGERLLLHFEQVDFRTHVLVNGIEAGVPHEGGQVPFTYDVTDKVKAGPNELVVAVWDPTHAMFGARGKQHPGPFAIWYTRNSGIMGTVWTEKVPATHLGNYEISTDFDRGTVSIRLDCVGDQRNAEGEIEILKDGKRIAAGAVESWNKPVTLKLPSPVAAWSPESPSLYDFVATVRDTRAKTSDNVKGYFAMRKVEVKKDPKGVLRIYFNNKMRFLVGTLDQGWWPDGLLVPPSDDAIKFDIMSLKKLGFDMMRKHIKVEPRRYYYLCDKLGMLVLQDMPSGGKDDQVDSLERYGLYRKELEDVVNHLINVPCIFGWVPYNEGWGEPGEFLVHSTLMWVKRRDPSRLVDGPSGAHDWEGGEIWGKRGRLTPHKPAGVEEAADLVDKHDYSFRPKPFAINDRRASFLGEYGMGDLFIKGHIWSKKYPEDRPAVTDVKLKEASILGVLGHVRSLARKGIVGSVYTQTTDVEDEVNGFLTYDRKVMKFDVAKIAAANEAIREGARLGMEPSELLEVVPKLDPRADAWRYTMSDPGPDWAKPDFDDSSWKRSPGGFGSRKAPEVYEDAKVVTLWNTKDLWLRRSFTLDKVEKDTIDAIFEVFHDDDAEIYLNGVRLFSVLNWNKKWDDMAVTPKEFFAVARKGENTIAVKVSQYSGEQYFDLGLKLEVRK